MYRVYLLDRNNHIVAGEFLRASDDREAVETASLVYEACSDAFGGFELWEDHRCVVANAYDRSLLAMPKLEDISQARQDNILDLEDTLQRLHACMKQSRKLLEVHAKLREQRANGRGMAG